MKNYKTRNLKTLTTDEFIEKYDNDTLEENNFLERYFIKIYYETGPIFELKYKI